MKPRASAKARPGAIRTEVTEVDTEMDLDAWLRRYVRFVLEEEGYGTDRDVAPSGLRMVR